MSRPDLEQDLDRGIGDAKPEASPVYGQLLGTHGIELSITQSAAELNITVTFNNFSRTVTAGITDQIRLISDAESLLAITGDTEYADPFLAIVDAKDITLVALRQPLPTASSTADFLIPKECNRTVTPDIVEAVEAHVRRSTLDRRGFQFVALPEDITFPNEKRDVNGQYIVSRSDEGGLQWYYPKALKLKKNPIRRVLAERGTTDEGSVQSARSRALTAPLIHGEETSTAADPLADVIASSNSHLTAFLNRALSIRRERRQAETDETDVEYISRLKERVLIAVGLSRMGNPPVDQIAQPFLAQTRTTVAGYDRQTLVSHLQAEFRTNPNFYRQYLNADIPAQREIMAWDLAVQQARTIIIEQTERDATDAELESASATLAQKAEPSGRIEIAADQATIIVDDRGDRIPSYYFFTRRGKAPMSIEELCALPIRPVLLPTGTPESGARGLATFLFDEILHSRQVCDTRGALVRMSDGKRQDYIDKLTRTIRAGVPITATEYLPMIAVANPIKRNTQQPALAELDLVRRRVEIIRAVEMYYEPGMKWLLGNEAPAFQGPMFGLDNDYVTGFERQVGEFMHAIDPDGTRLQLFNMADLLWGTDTRRQQWEQYKRVRYQAVRDAYDNPEHMEHADVVMYINTFIYPMATCINPYRIEAAQGLTMEQILQVYARLRTLTGTGFRGVDAAMTDYDPDQVLEPRQQELLRELYNWGKEVTFKYRTAMDSRDALPAFHEFIPDDAIAHTIISKPDKLVLFPNSGRGAFFPAHGEPVLQPASTTNGRTAVTVHPWWQIASQTDRYLPFYIKDREEPLYFVEV